MSNPRSLGTVLTSIVTACVVGVMPGPVSAQEAVASFDALSGRIRVGETIWVTDTTGREVR